ncbi:hypothetical protein SCUP234_09971 [Seiridium cupressi]
MIKDITSRTLDDTYFSFLTSSNDGQSITYIYPLAPTNLAEGDLLNGISHCLHYPRLLFQGEFKILEDNPTPMDRPASPGRPAESPIATPPPAHVFSPRSSLAAPENPCATTGPSTEEVSPLQESQTSHRRPTINFLDGPINPFAAPGASRELWQPGSPIQNPRKASVRPSLSIMQTPQPSGNFATSRRPSRAARKDSMWSVFSSARTASVWSTSSTRTVDSVRSYRSTSSNSPMYMFKDPVASSKELPYEQPALSDDEFAVFTALAKEQQRLEALSSWSKSVCRGLYLLLLLSIVYFALIGYPFHQGGVRWFWNFFHDEAAQSSIGGLLGFIIAGSIRNILPQVLCTFERAELTSDPEKPRDASECCVIIPCYKSAETLRATLPACLAIFNPEQIFVVANGNSQTPLDHTADVCAEFGVRHCWVPVGSKITAEFVGVALAREYKYCMLIDDDVLLPASLPLPLHLFGDSESEDSKIACIGYTIKSVGANSSRGTLIQQAQDIEYKVAGLAKVFQTHYGSVIFPHGAIAVWRRDILEQIFHGHPGYHISEDWYLGHTARAAGYRMIMSSQAFIETETPPRLFPSLRKKGGSRGGYGEMSIYKQRFFRWNFFFVFRIWSNTNYLLFSWRLGWRELITKLYVAGECYDSFIWLLAPIVIPTSLAASWPLTLMVTAGLVVFNGLLVVWFNSVHLGLLRRGRGSNEKVAWLAFPVYMFLKSVMLFVNIASIYWSIYEYAFFFTQQHLRVTESVEAWEVIRKNRNTPVE